jgi:tetratricopeptide (TPR) repeat protein
VKSICSSLLHRTCGSSLSTGCLTGRLSTGRLFYFLATLAVLGPESARTDEGYIVQPSMRAAGSLAPEAINGQQANNQTKMNLVSSVSPIGPSSGWESIGRQLAGFLSHSEQLSRRGVLLSAREEANQALLVLARHLDLLSNNFVSEPGFHAAQIALREVMDFTNWLHTTDPARIQQIVDSHETPVLKGSQWDTVSPLTIAQHYQRFAETKLVEASQGHPWFSDILYVLGRTYQAEADQSSGAIAETVRMHALIHYRAALEIKSSHALASNQAGFVLLQLDRPHEARGYLIASVKQSADSAALLNLAEASRRLGDHQTQRWAMQILASSAPPTEADRALPVVEVLDQRTFAALSPMAAGPKTAPMSPTGPISPLADSPAQAAISGGHRPY